MVPVTERKYDESLSFPPPSTSDLGKSGKVDLATLAETQIRAQFNHVFGTQDIEMKSRKALKIEV